MSEWIKKKETQQYIVLKKFPLKTMGWRKIYCIHTNEKKGGVGILMYTSTGYKRGKNHMITSIDAKKAFDKITAIDD